ncbi:hypothetical protein JCM5353_007062 [Sporobolomyces roseus]
MTSTTIRSAAVRHRPLAKLPQAVAACSETGAVYGKCIGSRYQEVEKNMCQAEFQAFRQCVANQMKKSK